MRNIIAKFLITYCGIFFTLLVVGVFRGEVVGEDVVNFLLLNQLFFSVGVAMYSPFPKKGKI